MNDLDSGKNILAMEIHKKENRQYMLVSMEACKCFCVVLDGELLSSTPLAA